MVHKQSHEVSWAALYLFVMAGGLGHLATWMLWRGFQSYGMVLLILSPVVLALFLDALEHPGGPVEQDDQGAKADKERVWGAGAEALPQHGHAEADGCGQE